MVAIHALRRFCLMLSVLGLVFAPASIGTAMASMTLSAASEINIAMGDEMPCCPDEQPVKTPDCSKACPLALICSTNLLCNFGTTLSWAVPAEGSSSIFFIPEEGQLRSAMTEPPARPPKV